MRMYATLAATLLTMVATAVQANPTTILTDDTAAVLRANAQFYRSLNALFTGDAQPMSRVWSHADDVTYMGPSGGFQIGWEQVRNEWETQAARKLGGEVSPHDVQVTVSGDVAIVHCYELGQNHDGQGQIVRVSIRATNLFRKENGQWKMIGHHTDLLPFLEKSSRPSTR